MEVRAKLGDDLKIALALDNASIHTCKKVKKLLSSPEVNMVPLWNVPGRPDLLCVGMYIHISSRLHKLHNFIISFFI